MGRSRDRGTRVVGLPNLRDVGGVRTAEGGFVRRGEVYRSSVPFVLDPDGLAAFRSLRLRSIADLRTKPERESAPTIVPEGAVYHTLDVLADATEPSPADIERMLASPSSARRLGGEAPFDLGRRRFGQLVRLDSARQGYGALFGLIADATARPALIHCSTGKDRTGWAVAALLSLLGVARDDIVSDYLLSAKQLRSKLEQSRSTFVERGGDARLFDALMGVERDFLEASFDEVERSYGSVDKYFEEGLGVGPSTQRALIASLVVRL